MKNILMNKEMAKKINENKKTQTRRVIKIFYNLSLKEPKKNPIFFKNISKTIQFKELQGFFNPCLLFYDKNKDNTYYCSKKIKYSVGEKLWIREPAIIKKYLSSPLSIKIEYQLKSNPIKKYKMDLPERFLSNPKKWITNCQSTPNGCIKEMAKTFIIITELKVEKLQDITFKDIIKEGYDNKDFEEYLKRTKRENIKAKDFVDINEINAFEWFKNLWNKTSSKEYNWNTNPFVIVYSFKKITNNKLLKKN